MTDHLPEVRRFRCVLVEQWNDGKHHVYAEMHAADDGLYVMHGDHVAALRACETRVRAEYESQDCYTLGFAHGVNSLTPEESQRRIIVKNFDAGLDAARDAVAAAYSWARGTEPQDRAVWLSDALAAIDAQRATP
jgi:hypothetical protein